MSDEKTVQTWGYNKDGGKIFDLKPGEALPAGYVDSPARLAAKTIHEQNGPFDHDGDGRPGGSLPKRGRKPKDAA